jgi:tetratricopeptide (TPR) repeat protein
MHLRDYADYRKIASHNISSTASIVEIMDTDSLEWKRVVYEDGAECTFTFEDGKWKRAFDNTIYDNALDEYYRMQYGTSVQSMFSVIETDPYDPRGYLLLSRDYRLYHQAPNYLNQSLIYAEKAMSMAKFTRNKEVKSSVYFNLADLYRELRNKKMEIEYCEKGFKANRDDYAANYFFGSALVRNGRVSDGLIYLKKCYALEPDNPLIWGYFLDHPELKKPIMD